MELQPRLVAGEFVAAPANSLEMHIRVPLCETGFEFVHGANRKPVEPSFKCHAIGLVDVLVQSSRNRFVHYFFPIQDIGF